MNHRKITQSYGEYHYYYCSTYKKMGNCTKHSIRSDKLEAAVLQALQQQISLAVEMDQVMTPSIRKENFDSDIKSLEASISALQENLDELAQGNIGQKNFDLSNSTIAS